MRMMPGGGARWRQQESCPRLCVRQYPPSLTERLCALLRPFVAELRPFPRLNLLTHRRAGRCGLLLCFATVLFFIIATYISPIHLGTGGWLYGIGIGRGPGGSELCPLMCPQISPSDDTWKPHVIPTSHPCQMTVVQPVPCPVNKTTSTLLQMPPLHFLANYRTPCWYQPLPRNPESNPYRQNLYNCFSELARNEASNMASVWITRAQAERVPRRLRCLPYFYIAGMPKSGSTDLFRKLTLHPDVVRTPMKEPHWWTRNRFGQRLNYSSEFPLSDYVDLFDKAALQIEARTLHTDTSDNEDTDSMYNHDIIGITQDTETLFHHVITGDASASTFWSNDNWMRSPENCGRDEPLFTNAHYIRRLTPDARIIVIFRNPTERLYSDYLYFQRINKSVSQFHQEALMSIDKLQACLKEHSLRACVYDVHVANGAKVRLRIGLYHVYLEEWLKVFPPEQLLIIRTEDYAKDLRHYVRKVYRFLGLRDLSPEEEDKVVGSPRANMRKTKDRELGPMLAETRGILQEFHRPYNQFLAQLLNDPKYLWDDITVDTQRSPANGKLKKAKIGGDTSVLDENTEQKYGLFNENRETRKYIKGNAAPYDVKVLRHRDDESAKDYDKRGQERTTGSSLGNEGVDEGASEGATVPALDVTLSPDGREEDREGEEDDGYEYSEGDTDSGYEEYEEDEEES